MVGTGTTKPGWGTGDPGYHPRCRFFGGPEMKMVAEGKKKDEPCPQQWKKGKRPREHRTFSLIELRK